MWSPSRISRARTIGAVLVLGTMLSACSDIYYDRRETIALGAKDAVDTDQIEQMIDPWPRNSGNRNIAFNGEKMQTAVQRYRTNRVIAPVNVTTSSAAYQAAQQSAAAAANAADQQTMSAPAAAVK
jgi:hypothetical protein